MRNIATLRARVTTFDPTLEIPWGYGTTYRRLDAVRTDLLVHYHPEYVRRLLAWLTSKAGTVGIGGTWRAGGAQPDKPGFAPEGKSFHQDQNYNDGFTGACAVDLVARDGPDAEFNHDAVAWSMVPAQGSVEAAVWGVHCNVSTEAWHMQPVEIDGWQSWWDAGRPAPAPNYPLPEEFDLATADEILTAVAAVASDVRRLEGKVDTFRERSAHRDQVQSAVIRDRYRRLRDQINAGVNKAELVRALDAFEHELTG